MKKIALAVLSLELIALGAVRAQAPTGAIAGVVTDPTGAVIPSARVVITNNETGLKRALATGAGGDYSAPALLAGVYEVTAEAPGFQRLARVAIIEAGSTTTVNLTMQLGATSETVTVDAASPQIRYDTNGVGGVVTRPQIEGCPSMGVAFWNWPSWSPAHSRQRGEATTAHLSRFWAKPWATAAAVRALQLTEAASWPSATA